MTKTFNASDILIPLGSLILVTGGNGLIGSHCVNEVLAAGYRVRTTVRDVKRCSWMKQLFDAKYPDKFELFEVSDVFAEGYLDKAVKGVAAIIHTVPTSISFMEKGPEPATSREISTVVEALQAAKKEPRVKRFVLTSSTWAAGPCNMKEPYTFDQNSWNEFSIKRAYSQDQPPDGLHIFMSLKARMEQEAWKWVKKNKPAFTMSSVLPYTVMGNIISPENQSPRSTASLVKTLFDGGPEGRIGFMKRIGPAWYIDSADCGRLHLIAAIDPSVENERLFGHAGKASWDDILEFLRKRFPNKKFMDNLNLGSNPGTVPTERGDELLRKYYGSGWTTLEDCIEANLKSLAKC